MKRIFNSLKELQGFLALWGSQSLSSLGSSMTSFALIIWAYGQSGSALTTALLSVCSYTPYVLLSVFAGVAGDRLSKKRTMLVCDSTAAITTCLVWLLMISGRLAIWHLYVINAVSGVMNALQQPASEVTVTMLTPAKYYQRVGGLRAFSNSLVTLLAPVLATAVLGFWGIGAVIFFDLASFLFAFVTLVCFIRMDESSLAAGRADRESFLASAGQGIGFLRANRGILGLILFLAAINFIASIYQAALTPMLLSRNGGSERALGLVNGFCGAANLAGSLFAAVCPAPKSRVRVIMNSLLFVMCTENFILAFGRSVPVWCLGAVLGWLCIPQMNTNLDALLRLHIPLAMQGRVYAVRNALQFFTIPLGYFAGGILVDGVFEPFMAAQPENGLLAAVFGYGKGSGCALLYFFLAFAGIFVCLYFRRNREIWGLEREE